MNIRCNGCGRSTDSLKLKTVAGRDYLLCKLCGKGGNHERATVSSEPSSGISDVGGEGGADFQ